MKKTSVIVHIIFSFVIFVVPAIVYGAGLVPCDTNCGFKELMTMVNNVIKFIFFNVAIPLTTISFMYIGGRLIINPNKTEERTKAIEAFKDIGIGFGIMIGAFVLIKFVLSQFLADGFSVDFLIK